jgi:hypothetical protein
MFSDSEIRRLDWARALRKVSAFSSISPVDGEEGGTLVQALKNRRIQHCNNAKRFFKIIAFL